MSKIIIIEGSDGSGKQTQATKLYEYIKKYRDNTIKITFPNYKSESSALVKMYLSGEFGDDATEINAYTSSLFFAVDRIATYIKSFKKYYLEDYIIISDRYTTSNMVHQASKLETKKEVDDYLSWLEDLEYTKMGLPRPNVVIFLNVPYEYTKKNIENRENKITGEMEKDIHEKNEEYLKKTYQNSLYVAKKMGWKIIDCIKEGKMRSIEDIHNEIILKLKGVIDGNIKGNER